MKINLNKTVDTFGGKVFVHTTPSGQREAHFDLSGLPRVDNLLIGQKVVEAPHIVEHLCGICPVPHHLAGMQALDFLERLSVPAEAQTVRSALHHASVVEAHALRLAAINRDTAMALRKWAKFALKVAGCPGHFPAVAIPGGVRTWPSTEQLAQLLEHTPIAITSAQQLGELALAEEKAHCDAHGSEAASLPNLALVDAQGTPSLMGSRARVATARGEIIAEFSSTEWLESVGEEEPGESASRPYLTALGPGAYYRVGPIAQLSVGTLSTPEAAQLQARWRAGQSAADTARAIITLHAVEIIERCTHTLLHLAEAGSLPPHETPSAGPSSTINSHLSGTATGWVDGPRGILAHTYTADKGIITSARIVTPTAQNEPWLAQLLTAAVNTENMQDREAALEDSIRQADPCLPVSSAPAGHMNVQIEEK